MWGGGEEEDEDTDLFVDAFPQLPGQLLGELGVLHVHCRDEALWLQRPLGYNHFPEVLQNTSQNVKMKQAKYIFTLCLSLIHISEPTRRA